MQLIVFESLSRVVLLSIKGRVSNLWKPMLIFEIIKTNTPLTQKGLGND